MKLHRYTVQFYDTIHLLIQNQYIVYPTTDIRMPMRIGISISNNLRSTKVMLFSHIDIHVAKVSHIRIWIQTCQTSSFDQCRRNIMLS